MIFVVKLPEYEWDRSFLQPWMEYDWPSALHAQKGSPNAHSRRDQILPCNIIDYTNKNNICVCQRSDPTFLALQQQCVPLVSAYYMRTHQRDNHEHAVMHLKQHMNYSKSRSGRQSSNHMRTKDRIKMQTDLKLVCMHDE